MKKNTARLVIIAVIIMIVLNSVLVVKLWTNQSGGMLPNRPPFKQVNDFIIREMGFDEAKAAAFRKISEKHHSNQQRHQINYRRVKDQLNMAMLDHQKEEVDSLLNELTDIVKDKELELYRFFEEVGTITTQDQQRKFSRIFGEATGAPDYAKVPMGGSTRRPPPPKR